MYFFSGVYPLTCLKWTPTSLSMDKHMDSFPRKCTPPESSTVDGRHSANQLIFCTVSPLSTRSIKHPRWLFGISSINSMVESWKSWRTTWFLSFWAAEKEAGKLSGQTHILQVHGRNPHLHQTFLQVPKMVRNPHLYNKLYMDTAYGNGKKPTL